MDTLKMDIQTEIINGKMSPPKSLDTNSSGTIHKESHMCLAEEFETPGQYERDGVTLPGSVSPKVLDWLEETFSFRPDDVLIMSYPKSGSTWLQLMIHLILNKEEIRQGEPSTEVQRLAYFLEAVARPGSTPNFSRVEALPSPRIMKSHLQYRHLQKTMERGMPRIICILRNPKDTLVSMFNFYRMYKVLGNFPGTWHDFFNMAMKKKVVYGSWFDHTKGWYNLRSHPKVIFLHFEDMKENPEIAVRKLGKFFDQTLTDSEILTICQMTDFQTMKASSKTSMTDIPGFNNSISQFLRKGEVADWKNFFTVAQNEYFDSLFSQEMSDCDLNIRFEMK